MMECECGYAGRPRAGGCPNCGRPEAARDAAAEPEVPEEALPGVEALRGILTAAGADAEGFDAAMLVANLLDLTSGYDGDPAEELGRRPGDGAGSGVTLSLDSAVRTACERCALPVLGRLSAEWREGDRPIPPDRMGRAAEIVAARLHSEGSLAEQVAAAAVDLGGAEWASVKVELRRPCARCGGGNRKTTATADAKSGRPTTPEARGRGGEGERPEWDSQDTQGSSTTSG